MCGFVYSNRVTTAAKRRRVTLKKKGEKTEIKLWSSPPRPCRYFLDLRLEMSFLSLVFASFFSLCWLTMKPGWHISHLIARSTCPGSSFKTPFNFSSASLSTVFTPMPFPSSSSLPTPILLTTESIRQITGIAGIFIFLLSSACL